LPDESTMASMESAEYYDMDDVEISGWVCFFFKLVPLHLFVANRFYFPLDHLVVENELHPMVSRNARW
jgi:hypothetical protein